MILICYDGSSDSQCAIEHAGELLSGQPATVLTVWEPFIEVVTRTTYGFGMFPGSINVEEIDAANRQGAEARAQEGAALAGKAGLKAQPRTALTAHHGRQHDPQRGRGGQRDRDRNGITWPHRREICAAGKRVARGHPARRPRGDRGPLPPGVRRP